MLFWIIFTPQKAAGCSFKSVFVVVVVVVLHNIYVMGKQTNITDDSS